MLNSGRASPAMMAREKERDALIGIVSFTLFKKINKHANLLTRLTVRQIDHRPPFRFVCRLFLCVYAFVCEQVNAGCRCTVFLCVYPPELCGRAVDRQQFHSITKEKKTGAGRQKSLPHRCRFCLSFYHSVFLSILLASSSSLCLFK